LKNKNIKNQFPIQCMSISKYITIASLHSGIAWLVYAIVENLFSSIFPWIIKEAHLYKPLHWGFTSLLMLVIYPAIGFVLGAVFALLFRIAAGKIHFFQKIQLDILFPRIGTFTIVLMFSINLIHISLYGKQPYLFNHSVLATLFLSIVLMLAILISTVTEYRFKSLRFITSPWFISFVLLGVMWVSKELIQSQPFLIKVISIIVFITLMLFISFATQKIITIRFPGLLDSTVVPSRSRYLYLFSLVFLLIGLNIFFVQTPLLSSQSQDSSSLPFPNPNVILVVMDTVRADHMSLYGYERDNTPHLKKISQKATLFKHAIASGNMTLSTHASIFTGLYARRHGAHDPFPNKGLGFKPLTGEFDTLAEILSNKGYYSMAVVSNNTFLSPKYGLHQGFHHYDYRSRTPFFGGTYAYLLRQRIRNLLTYVVPPSTYDLVCRRAETINKEVFRLLEKMKEGNRSFFLSINYMDAHRPYIPPYPYNSQYPGKNEKYTPARYFFPMKEEIMKLDRQITEAEYIHFLSQYDGGIGYIDFHIGELIEKLKALNLYDNSIIIITSDHGEMFGEKQLVEHGISVYQDVIHVPLLIKYPNTYEGTVIDEFVSVVDIMPTVLEILGYEKPGDIHGKSLNSSDVNQTRFIISESFPSRYHIQLHEKYKSVERAIFHGHSKFISSTSGKRELYDLSKDDDEKANLNDLDYDTSKMMKEALKRWLKSVSKHSGETQKLDNDTLERLKSLGYIR